MNDNNDLFFGLVFLIIFAAIGSLLINLTRKHYQTRHEQIKIFLYALGVRFGASIVVYELGLSRVLGDEDGSGWLYGLFLSGGWAKQQLTLISLPEMWAASYTKYHLGFHYLCGLFFFATGASGRMPIAAMNCFFGALTVVFVYRIAISLFSRWTAVRAAWLACFFPSMIIWSAQTLKEPVVIFLESLALYACVNLKLSGVSVKYILLCAGAIILLPPFRFYAAYLTAAVAMLALFIPNFGKGKSSIQSAVLVASMIVPLVLSSGYLARNEAVVERYTQLKEIQRFKSNVAKGNGSGVTSNYDLNSTTGLALALAVGGAHLLLAPFPWQLGGGSVRMLLTAPELFVWWWLVFVGLFPGLWHVCKTRFNEVQPMLFFILGLGLLYSMMFGNVGLIFRQRAQLLPWLLIIAVVGLEQRAIRKLEKSQAQGGGAIAPVLAPKQA
jgi:hypothetical protein